MPGVRVKPNEPFEVALKRFKKQCEKAGILSEIRKREHYEKPSIKRKKKILAAKKRALKKLRKIEGSLISLYQRLDQAFKEAIKNQQPVATSTLRLLKSAIRYREVDARRRSPKPSCRQPLTRR